MEAKAKGNIWYGVGICAVWTLLAYPIAVAVASYLSPDFAPLMIVAVGVFQFLYIIPLAIYFWRCGKTATLQGVLIGAGITFLINGGCWGLVAVSLGGGIH